MKIMLLNLFAIAFLFLISCSNNKKVSYYQKENSEEYLKEFTFSETNSISFPLDSTTGFFTNSMGFTENKETQVLSILNPKDNSLILYDYKTRKLLKKINYAKEGPNGIGKIGSTASHYYVNKDTIMIYNMKDGRLYFSNEDAKIFKRVNLIDYKADKVNPVPHSNTRHPILKIGENVFIPGALNVRIKKYSTFNAMIKLNLKNDSLTYEVPLSDIYDMAHWGNYFKYHISFTYNDKKKYFAINYPIDPYLYKYNYTTMKMMDKVYLGSELFQSIEPMNYDVEYGYKRIGNNTVNEEQNDYSLTNNDYVGVYYDKYKDLYYRFTFIRPEIKDVRKGKARPKTSVIVSDGNFKKVAEILLSDNYDGSMFFITEKGLHISKLSDYLKNENLISFGIFSLKK